MRVQFLGSGDAFGSGGRFNTCIHVTQAAAGFLVDCGASSLIAMRRFDIDPNGISTIFISHLHGDHFGGLPFFILDGQFYSGRTSPLTIVGPPGLRQRLRDAMEVFFPGSSSIERRFTLEIIELKPEQQKAINDVTVTPYLVNHVCGAPPFALRFECGGKVLVYSGDTEWAQSLVTAARDADLFIVEASSYDKKVEHHLDWLTLRDHLPEIRAKRLVLTHMGPDMLGRAVEDGCEKAEDGKIIEV